MKCRVIKSSSQGMGWLKHSDKANTIMEFDMPSQAKDAIKESMRDDPIDSEYYIVSVEGKYKLRTKTIRQLEKQ